MPSVPVAGLGDVLREWRKSQGCTHTEWARKLHDAGLTMPLQEIEKNLQVIELHDQWPWLGQLVHPHPPLLRRFRPHERGMADPREGLIVPFEPEKLAPIVNVFLDAVRRGIVRPRVDDERWKRLYDRLYAVVSAELLGM